MSDEPEELHGSGTTLNVPKRLDPEASQTRVEDRRRTAARAGPSLADLLQDDRAPRRGRALP